MVPETRLKKKTNRRAEASGTVQLTSAGITQSAPEFFHIRAHRPVTLSHATHEFKCVCVTGLMTGDQKKQVTTS